MATKRRRGGQPASQSMTRGDTVFLPGQVADETAGETVAAQTQEILMRIDRLLAEAGTSKARLRAAHIRLTDMSAFAEMNGVWNGWMSDGPTHERATVEAELKSPAHAVEITVAAAR